MLAAFVTAFSIPPSTDTFQKTVNALWKRAVARNFGRLLWAV